MIHGSKMTRNHRGMRKGISLVEMMIAVVLFGVLSVVTFKYSKVYYDTDLTAKKARIAALIEQATQLSNAYDIYEVQVGTAPTAIGDLSSATAKILTATPATITEIGSAAGWTLQTGTNYGNTATNDVAFSFIITDVTPSTSNEEYCAVFNNMIDTAQSLNVTDGQDFGLAPAQYTALGDAFCFGTGATIEIVIMKEAN